MVKIMTGYLNGKFIIKIKTLKSYWLRARYAKLHYSATDFKLSLT